MRLIIILLVNLLLVTFIRFGWMTLLRMARLYIPRRRRFECWIITQHDKFDWYELQNRWTIFRYLLWLQRFVQNVGINLSDNRFIHASSSKFESVMVSYMGAL